MHNTVAGDLLYERQIKLRPFVTNELFNKHIATDDFNELDNRLFSFAYNAIMGMQCGKISWGTFIYEINKQSFILISIVQDSKQYGKVVTICLPNEV